MPYSKEEARQRKNDRQRAYAKRTDYAASKKYNAERGVQFSVRFFMPQDAELIAYIRKQPNKAQFFKNLVKKDMESNRK
jgi:hypothetical protein